MYICTCISFVIVWAYTMFVISSSSPSSFNVYFSCLHDSDFLQRSLIFQTCESGSIYLESQLLHILSNTLAMSFYLSLYQPYLLPATADKSLPSHHHICSLHIQTISIYDTLQPQTLSSLSFDQQLIRCHSTPQRNITHPSHHYGLCNCISLCNISM